MRFAVLNPAGRDPDRDFSTGPGLPTDPGHPPINHHAYAACTQGAFFRSPSAVGTRFDGLLLLLRPRHLASSLEVLKALKARGIPVFASWKESGLTQVCGFLSDPKKWHLLRAIAESADGFLSSTPDLVPLYRGAGFRCGSFIPTPYPLEYPEWDFSRPLSERQGVFVGTREFDVPARAHLAALSALIPLAESGCRVTVINSQARSGEKLCRSLSPRLNVVPGPLPTIDYLTLMASHRVVFQADCSAVPGQVAGDALLCAMPCIGGNGAIDRISLPVPSSLNDSLALTSHLLENDALWTRTVADSRARSFPVCSFAAAASNISHLLASANES